MGGVPVAALNVVMFPSGHLDLGVLKEILRGGNDKVVEAGACLAGGHTVDDNEPKYGLSVSGVVHPDNIITNSGAQPGDALILTKPLGSGVLFNAVRARKYDYGQLEREVLPLIAALNGPAMKMGLKYDLHACTDVTGFGILGHLLEMAEGAGVHAAIDYDALPFYPGAGLMYKKGQTTGSNRANRDLVNRFPLNFKKKLSNFEEELLFDPQTSGGLLMALPEDQAVKLLADLRGAGIEAAGIVGEMSGGLVGLTVR